MICDEVSRPEVAEKIRESWERTEETGNEHIFCICQDGRVSAIREGESRRLTIENVEYLRNFCDQKVGVHIHTHPHQDFPTPSTADIASIADYAGASGYSCVVASKRIICVRPIGAGAVAAREFREVREKTGYEDLLGAEWEAASESRRRELVDECRRAKTKLQKIVALDPRKWGRESLAGGDEVEEVECTDWIEW